MQILEEDFLTAIDLAFNGMLGIVEELGDERANMHPDLPGANSPYVILYHCVAVINFWVGTILAGRNIPRDRDSEFVARGTTAEIAKMVGEIKLQMREDIKHVRGDQPIAHTPSVGFNPPQNYESWTQGRVLIHAYKELAQHHGQMELTRDILVKST